VNPDRRTDHANRDRITILEERSRARDRRVTVLLSIVAALLFANGCVSFYLRGQQDSLAHQAQKQAQRAATLATSIQQSRFENVFRGCVQDAARNQATIARYDAALAKRLADAPKADRSELRARAVESRVFFVSLINAFLPRHSTSECRAIAHEQTHVPLPSG
jgi:hypothetical protein